MNTTVESLQALYVELGGKLTDTYSGIANGVQVGNYVTIPDCLAAVNALVKSGATKELPAATSDDSGKVVAVGEDGEYVLTDIETGGGETLLITGTRSFNDINRTGDYSLDNVTKTLNEVIAWLGETPEAKMGQCFFEATFGGGYKTKGKLCAITKDQSGDIIALTFGPVYCYPGVAVIRMSNDATDTALVCVYY
jgi:hypothetical protein